MQTFTEYLIAKCMEQTHTLDDDAPDVFESWIASLDSYAFIFYAEKWCQNQVEKSRGMNEKEKLESSDNRGNK